MANGYPGPIRHLHVPRARIMLQALTEYISHCSRTPHIKCEALLDSKQYTCWSETILGQHAYFVCTYTRVNMLLAVWLVQIDACIYLYMYQQFHVAGIRHEKIPVLVCKLLAVHACRKVGYLPIEVLIKVCFASDVRFNHDK